jgi:acetyl esterase/lipase
MKGNRYGGAALLVACMALCGALARAGTLPEIDDDGASGAGPSWSVPPGVAVLANVAYGTGSKQAFDVYLPPSGAAAKGVIVMVHGGGWRYGDKGAANVVANKVAWFVPQGFALVSVNYDLIPDAYPVAQAQEVAKALAKVQSMMPAWGAPQGKVILMGHSAGANLVAQLAADPAAAYGQGARPWAGTVSLDSAAMDVPQLMARPHLPLYDHAFGADKAYWVQASPTLNMHKAGGPALLVCSTHRRESCPQAEGFARAARAAGRYATVLPEDLSHREINVDLGLAGDYTNAVQAFVDLALRGE